jgi:hypothetical protein
VLRQAQNVLLRCATPEAVVRLPVTHLSAQADALFDSYFIGQEHGSLQQLMVDEFKSNSCAFLQVIFSTLLLICIVNLIVNLMLRQLPILRHYIEIFHKLLAFYNFKCKNTFCVY